MASFWQLRYASQIVCSGGVIAYPTEAVWGLGCDPWNEQAVIKLLALKRRAIEKGVILIGGSIDQFDFLLQGLSKNQLTLLQQSWPGANTWLVPHYNKIPYWITGDHSTVAIRVPGHRLARELCLLTGPIVSTSANIANYPAAKSRLMVEYYFHNQLDVILNGEIGKSKTPSRICDLETGKIIR